jgi:hypothetical protein
MRNTALVLFLATALALLSREKTTLLFRSEKLTSLGSLAAYAVNVEHDVTPRVSAYSITRIFISSPLFASLAVFWHSGWR